MRLKQLLTGLAALVFAAAPPAHAQATFEGLTSNATPPPSGYAGKDWSFYVTFANGQFGSYNTPSGNEYGLIYCCGYPNSLTNTGGGAFNFLSALVGDPQGSEAFTASGYFNNVLQYSHTFVASQAWHTETFGFNNIDRLEFTTTFNTNLTLDDMDFSASVVTPEPATLSLMGIGIAGIFGIRLRRRRAA
jgi:hypothetical protein